MPSKVEDSYDLADDPPTSINPYEVLSIAEDATEDDIKKAYRKAALRNHPDKAAEEDKVKAKENFQNIAFAYAVLSDPRRRKRYDATGSTAETLDLEDDDFDWLSFYRAQYKNIVTEEAIIADKKEYQGSEEEREAVLNGYRRGKGNIDTVYETVMHSNVLEDDERFRRIIDEAIEKEEVEAFDKYTKETEKSKQARIKKAKRQAEEAAAAEKEIKQKERKKKNGAAGNEDMSLAALIQQRQKGRETRFFEHLEEKYAPKAKGKKRGPAHVEEPPEEAFAATAARAKKSRK